MNISKLFLNMQKISKILTLLVLLLSFGFVFADPLGSVPLNPVGGGGIVGAGAGGVGTVGTTSNSGINQALSDLCNNSRIILSVAAMLLIVMAALTYSIGQILGAETRARAVVWATSMVIGAVIGLIIYLIVPPIIATLFGNGATFTNSANPCTLSIGS